MTPRQFWLVTLEVLAIVLGTFATFMPMKAILLLASGTVPQFFPDPLVTAGPFPAAVVLLLASILFGLTATLASRLAVKGRLFEAVTAHHAASLVPGDLATVAKAKRLRVSAAAELVIVILFGALLAWISLPFILLTVSWLAIAFLWTQWTSRQESVKGAGGLSSHSPRRPYQRLVRSSILPSSIVISLLVLLVSEPRLGVTGALLAIVVGRRFQMSSAALVAERFGEGATGEDDSAHRQRDPGGHGPAPQATVVERLAPARDGNSLDQFLQSRGRRLDECLLIGSGSGQQGLTLVPNDGEGAASTYWRVFPREAWHVRDLELGFRRTHAPVSLFAGESVEALDLGSLSLLEVTSAVPFWANERVGWKTFRAWHRSVVAECLASPEFQRWAEAREVSFPESELASQLALALSVPGLHQEELGSLASIMAQVNEQLRTRPYCWGTHNAFRPSGLLLRLDGGVMIASPHGWGVGRSGEASGAHMHSMADESMPDSDVQDNVLDDLAEMAQRRTDLLKNLRKADYSAAARSAGQLRALFIAATP